MDTLKLLLCVAGFVVPTAVVTLAVVTTRALRQRRLSTLQSDP